LIGDDLDHKLFQQVKASMKPEERDRLIGWKRVAHGSLESGK